MAALDAAKESGEYEYPLDLGMNDQGEWYPYAFLPFLWSLGGSMVDRDTYQTAEGHLNGDAAIEFGEWWQRLFEEGYAPGTSEVPPRSGARLHRRPLRVPVERQLARRRDDGGGRRRGVPARPRLRRGQQHRRRLLAVRRFGHMPQPRWRQRLHRVRAAGQVPRRLLGRHRPDPVDARRGGDDRELRRGRPACRVLRPVGGAGDWCAR